MITSGIFRQKCRFEVFDYDGEEKSVEVIHPDGSYSVLDERCVKDKIVDGDEVVIVDDIENECWAIKKLGPQQQ